ncbi:aldolase [Paenibacillus sp. GSMTC-2017]|uniref:aldolase n=1 Tax=Paenibacillus sp. GSMTC-2017 TaxID=2794350 RepID=UPI001E58E624|nr:aldolase [Paenibacillus sp. GSMTC-2017]
MSDQGGHGATPELTVTIRDLSTKWQELEPISEYVAIDSDTVYIRVPDTAIFAMYKGENIFISAFPNASIDKIRLYVLGTCMGIILMQKHILPLHGSAISINGNAYAVVGHSGAGKTTTSSYLIEQGYQLLSDDLIAVTFDENNTPLIMPAYPQQKIWQQTIDMLGMDAAGLKPLFDRETKFAVPVPGSFCNKPLPLAGIFELVKTDNDAPSISPIQGLERFHTLLQHTFRGFLIKRLGLLDWHFGTLARFANHIEMNRLYRPQSGDSLNALGELLLQSINKESNKNENRAIV